MPKPDETLAPKSAVADDATPLDGVRTWATPPKPVVIDSTRPSCLVHIYPTGPGMGSRISLADKPMIVGRDPGCDIRLDDPSISRQHAEIRPGLTGHYVIDLQSTNGTFINDRPTSLRQLKDGDYLRFSNWIFRYLTGGNVEAEYHEEIYRLTIIDALTGVPNKRYLLEFLERELARTARHGRPLSLILLDIDRFKAINDQFGHLAGDAALRELASCLKDVIRKEELFARYGGEEFAIVLPETSRPSACSLAERLRDLVANHPFDHQGQAFPVTISLGVVTTDGTPPLAPDQLIRQADEKLYQAKNEGRNRLAF